VEACNVANHGVWVMDWLGFLYCISMDYDNRTGAAVLSTAPPNSAYRTWAKRLGVNTR
jgi:hypothetical protein